MSTGRHARPRAGYHIPPQRPTPLTLPTMHPTLLATGINRLPAFCCAGTGRPRKQGQARMHSARTRPVSGSLHLAHDCRSGSVCQHKIGAHWPIMLYSRSVGGHANSFREQPGNGMVASDNSDQRQQRPDAPPSSSRRAARPHHEPVRPIHAGLPLHCRCAASRTCACRKANNGLSMELVTA